MSDLRIGCGVVDITPEPGVYLAGYFEKRIATRVNDKLYAKALLFERDGYVSGILCCDLIDVGRKEVERIRTIISERCGIDGERIMICATHTHTGPSTREWVKEEEGPNRTWLEAFPETAAQAVDNAMKNLEPCTMYGGQAMEDRIAFNRRYRMKDGTVQTNPGIRNPDIIEPAGPIDPEVGVLCFKRTNGTMKAIYVNYACHLDTVGGTAISADYPGYLARRLTERLADKPFVIFTNGACGDVNHIDVRSPYRRQGHEHSRWMGETLAGDVCEALNALSLLDSSIVRSVSRMIQLPMRKDADKSIGRVEVQVIRVGDVAFVGSPSEYFVELQLDIKRRSPFERTFVSELANGSVGYVPTRKAFEENMKDVPAEKMNSFDHKGYEVRSALAQGFLPGVGEMIADTAVQLLNKLHG